MKAVLFPLLAVMCWAAFFYKLRHLRRGRRDPALLALLVAFALKATAFVLATPAVAAAVDRRTGTPDLAALGIHLFGGVGFGAAVLVAVVFWTHPPRSAWPKVRLLLAAATVVTFTMCSLWVAARNGSQGRATHYLTENAGRPVVDAYLLLYVLTLVLALGEIARLCLRYAGSTGRPWLRRGLRATSAGALIYSVNFVDRASSLVAVRLGLDPLDWEVLVTVGLAVGVPLLVGGLTMPSWGPRLSAAYAWWRDLRSYRRLGPLWLALHRVVPEITLHPPTSAWADPEYRLYRRIIEIRDGMLALRRYLDPAVAETAARRGQEAHLRGEELSAVVEAAQLKAAVLAKERGAAVSAGIPAGQVTGQDSGRDTGHDQGGVPAARTGGHGGRDLVSESAWLGRVARAYVRSPIVSLVADGAVEQRAAR